MNDKILAQYGNFTLVDVEVIKDNKLSPSDKLIFAVLCANADDERSCSLRVKIIANQANCSERSVHTSLNALVAHGIIKREARFNDDGGQIESNYKLIGFQAACYCK